MMGLILYGPPAAGKDTITEALHSVSPEYRIFRRIKVGGGRAEGYRMMTEPDVTDLRTRGEIVWENHRYDSAYYVDRTALLNDLKLGIPVVHLGQSAAIAAVSAAVEGAHWVVVSVWCPRDVAERRIVARGTGDADQRLRAWDATEPIRSDVSIDSGEMSPDRAARIIDQSVRAVSPGRA